MYFTEEMQYHLSFDMPDIHPTTSKLFVLSVCRVDRSNRIRQIIHNWMMEWIWSTSYPDRCLFCVRQNNETVVDKPTSCGPTSMFKGCLISVLLRMLINILTSLCAYCFRLLNSTLFKTLPFSIHLSPRTQLLFNMNFVMLYTYNNVFAASMFPVRYWERL